jgi:hypothetical protein
MDNYPKEQYAGTATESVAAKEVSPVQRVLNENGELIDQLHMSIDRLVAKLSPVTSRMEQADGRTTDGLNAPMPGSSQYIEQLLNHQAQLERAVRYVRNLTGSLEI